MRSFGRILNAHGHTRPLVPACLPRPRTARKPARRLEIANALTFDAAPVEVIIGGGVFVLASAGFLIAEAIKASKGEDSPQVAQVEPTSEEVLPRENAVLVFGASGRTGRKIVGKVWQC